LDGVYSKLGLNKPHKKELISNLNFLKDYSFIQIKKDKKEKNKPTVYIYLNSLDCLTQEKSISGKVSAVYRK